MRTLAVLLDRGGTRAAVEFLLDGQNARRLLHDLAGRSLIKISVGPAGRVYYQHAIIQAFYYDDLNAAQRTTLHLQAARYFELQEKDQFQAAIHYARCGDYARAVELVTRDTWAFVHQGYAATLYNLLNHVPPAQVSAGLRVQLYEANGDLAHLQGDLGAAATHFEQALALLPPTSEQREIRLARKMAEVLTRLGEYARAERCLLQSNAALQAISVTSLDRALLDAGWGTLYIAMERYDDAINRARNALRSLGKLSTQRVAADLYDIVGKAKFYLGEYSEAVTEFQSALQLREPIGDEYGMLRSYSNIALVRNEQSWYTEAAAANRRAIAMAEQLGDRVAQAVLYGNLATNLVNLEQFDEALVLHERALAMSQQLGEVRSIYYAQVNLGDLYRRMGRYQDAIAYITAATETAHQLQYESGIAETRYELAQVYFELGQLADAKQLVDRLFEEIGEGQDRIRAYWIFELRGLIAYRCGEAAVARYNLRQAVVMCQEMGATREAARVLREWATYERQAGEVAAAEALDAEWAANQSELR